MKFVHYLYAIHITVAALISTSALAQASENSVDTALKCKIQTNCPSFSDVFKSDPAVSPILKSAFAASDLTPPAWYEDGVESQITPIVFQGKMGLIGNICKPHFCRTSLTFIYFPKTKRVIGLSLQETRTWLGEPDAEEQALLSELKTRGSPLYQRLRTPNEPLPIEIKQP